MTIHDNTTDTRSIDKQTREDDSDYDSGLCLTTTSALFSVIPLFKLHIFSSLARHMKPNMQDSLLCLHFIPHPHSFHPTPARNREWGGSAASALHRFPSHRDHRDHSQVDKGASHPARRCNDWRPVQSRDRHPSIAWFVNPVSFDLLHACQVQALHL